MICDNCIHKDVCSDNDNETQRDYCTWYEKERPHGEWIITGGYRPSYKCSICGYSYSSNFIYSANFIEHNFCPNCGADMREGEADEKA